MLRPAIFIHQIYNPSFCCVHPFLLYIIPFVRELPNSRIERMSRNASRNSKMEYYFLKMLANGIVKKRMPPAEIDTLRNRMKRLQGCHKFWLTDTYKKSHIKVLLRTYLCKDRFCNNCSQMRKLILQNHFLPYLEQNKDRLYHIVLLSHTVLNIHRGNLLSSTIPNRILF